MTGFTSISVARYICIHADNFVTKDLKFHLFTSSTREQNLTRLLSLTFSSIYFHDAARKLHRRRFRTEDQLNVRWDVDSFSILNGITHESRQFDN
jgi:UDP-2,3-diacylglucosamine pyrophosphatase LpxH